MEYNEKDKSDFVNYERIRRSGKFNMIVDASIIANKMGISNSRYIWIINNYSELNRLYCDEV